MALPAIRQQLIEGIEEQLAFQDTRPERQGRLEDHQVDAVRDVHDHLRRGFFDPASGRDPLPSDKQFDGGTIDMATGTGKTWVAMTLAAAAVKKGQRVVIATPRVHINQQFYGDEDHPGLVTHPEWFGLQPGDVVRYDRDASNDERQRAINGQAKIIITTDEGLRQLHFARQQGNPEQGVQPQGISPDPVHPHFVGTLILDESDARFTGDVTGRIIRQYLDNSAVYSISATNFSTNLRLYNNQAPIHSLPIYQAPANHEERPGGALPRGMLVGGIKTAVLQVTPDKEVVRSLAYDLKHRNEISEEAADRLANDLVVGYQVARFHGTHIDEHMGPIQNLPTLISVSRETTARHVADLFNQAYGRPIAAAVSGKTPTEDTIDQETGNVVREGLNSLIRRFNRGDSDLKVLVFPEVLGRGVDIPNASVFISMRPYLSPTPVIQHMGRITRKGTENYEQLFGVPKSAGLAVNVETPNMQPYRFSQVIGGPVQWAAGPPAPYRTSGPTPPPPEIPAHIPPANSITNYQELASLHRDAVAAYAERQREIPKGLITLEEAMHDIADDDPARRQQFQEMLDKISPQGRYTSYGVPIRKVPDYDGPVMLGRQLKDNKHRRQLISEAFIASLQQHLMAYEERLQQGGLDLPDAAKQLGKSEEEVDTTHKKWKKAQEEKSVPPKSPEPPQNPPAPPAASPTSQVTPENLTLPPLTEGKGRGGSDGRNLDSRQKPKPPEGAGDQPSS